jgi:hypothetical protein
VSCGTRGCELKLVEWVLQLTQQAPTTRALLVPEGGLGMLSASRC